MTIRKEIIDELVATHGSNLIGPNGLAKELTKALVERMLAGEPRITWGMRGTSWRARYGELAQRKEQEETQGRSG